MTLDENERKENDFNDGNFYYELLGQGTKSGNKEKIVENTENEINDNLHTNTIDNRDSL